MGLDNIRLGKRIKAARKRIGLSQLVLSEALDCTPNHLSYIENGNRSLSLAKFVQLANALGTSADELLMDSLDNVSKAMNHQFSSVMADCSEREKRVLLRACLKSFDKNGGVGDNRKKQAGAGENASIPK